MREYWLNDCRSLEEIAATVSVEFDAELEGDCENVYEWFEGESADRGLKFNISRKHIEDRADPGNPVRISISGPSYPLMGVDALGARLASCLGSQLQFGNVSYLGGDDFQFERERHYYPA